MQIKISEIIYRKDLYPRFNPDQKLIDDIFPVTWNMIEPRMGTDVCGFIQKGVIYFYYSVASQMFEKNGWAFSSNEDSLTESKYQSFFVKTLTEISDNIQQYKKCLYGIIDVCIEQESVVKIYELKVFPDTHTILAALGQLLSYSYSFDKVTELYFVCNTKISPKYKELLGKYDVKVIIFDGYDRSNHDK